MYISQGRRSSQCRRREQWVGRLGGGNFTRAAGLAPRKARAGSGKARKGTYLHKVGGAGNRDRQRARRERRSHLGPQRDVTLQPAGAWELFSVRSMGPGHR